MEFFDWVSVPQYIISALQGGVTLGQLYICLGVAGGLYLVCLVFGGLGLYSMAKRAGVKHPWLGFIPFVNTWYTGKIAGEANFFGQKMKRAGLYAMLVEIAYVGVNVLSLVVSIFLSNPAYYDTVIVNGQEVLEFKSGRVPLNLQWMVSATIWTEILSALAYLMLVVFLCVVFTALYRKYYARSPFLMTFFSAVFPFRGFVIFAVRKNTPVDYNAYMRRRMEEMMRQNGQYYGNPQQGGYGGGQADGGGRRESDPFSDFGDTKNSSDGENPFSEFDDPPSHPQP